MSLRRTPQDIQRSFERPFKKDPAERNKTNNIEQLYVENVNVILSDIEYLIKY